MAWRPVLALLLMAPYLGEVLSTATSPLDLLLPWNLALFVALYGSGALLCREMAHRWGLVLPGLALLGAAYGVYEEALVDRFWFDPKYAHDTGIGDYAQVWHTNLLLATHLTAFHTAVSVCSSVLVVTWLFPGDRDRAWVRPRGLVVAGIAMLLVLFLVYEDHVRPTLGPVLVALGVSVLIVVTALLSRRLPRLARASSRRPRPRLLGVVAFVCTGTHFVLVYAVPSTGLPWPAGLAATLTPLVVGVLAARRWATTGPLGRDGLWVVTGILGFFVVLDALVGLGGRYDLTVSAVLTALVLAWLHRRVPAAAIPTPPR
ncbi:hypothetical protein [Sphaerisporangium perillae]|uniref:hypothetical protein n=1 Tax=Sphaerisporangium perillae TaxID=2935860 RepID=UPI00200F88AF|nr:hypothetical protein [Sphaerisporangium perillae]